MRGPDAGPGWGAMGKAVLGGMRVEMVFGDFLDFACQQRGIDLVDTHPASNSLAECALKTVYQATSVGHPLGVLGGEW